eukprot:CAMPEP_0197405410 /NCGR_PEP_ID=MMETSP1165-20131217/24364_1 /TAXON_ID=284809 /ORGANISM="Chrysocystis fragilis, Strain CCMP3189" /LENGTH=224 /DNA_ID=CAMNT_0042931725 /DNA_START=15 /DNA_END=686 /DNA_ORIENTATION=-
MKYLSRAEATAVDVALDEALSEDVVAELEGLAVAMCVHDAYPADRVLAVCGPDTNGTIGLVAARYLAQFGHEVVIVLPRPRRNMPTSAWAIPVMDRLPETLEDSSDVVIDAIFDFSFSDDRPPSPFDRIIGALHHSAIPVVSVDVPSGWDADDGPTVHSGLQPDVLISLVAPKACAMRFTGGAHYLAARFVPPAIQEKFAFRPPAYTFTHQYVRLDKVARDDDD